MSSTDGNKSEDIRRIIRGHLMKEVGEIRKTKHGTWVKFKDAPVARPKPRAKPRGKCCHCRQSAAAAPPDTKETGGPMSWLKKVFWAKKKDPPPPQARPQANKPSTPPNYDKYQNLWQRISEVIEVLEKRVSNLENKTVKWKKSEQLKEKALEKTLSTQKLEELEKMIDRLKKKKSNLGKKKNPIEKKPKSNLSISHKSTGGSKKPNVKPKASVLAVLRASATKDECEGHHENGRRPTTSAFNIKIFVGSDQSDTAEFTTVVRNRVVEEMTETETELEKPILNVQNHSQRVALEEGLRKSMYNGDERVVPVGFFGGEPPRTEPLRIIRHTTRVAYRKNQRGVNKRERDVRRSLRGTRLERSTSKASDLYEDLNAIFERYIVARQSRLNIR